MDKKCIMGKINMISETFDKFMIKKIKAEGLPILQNHITLFHILPEDGSKLLFNEVANIWNISKSSLSDIINKYENQGLINKCECHEDRRSIHIILKEDAMPIKRRILELEEDFRNVLLEDFTQEEKVVFEDNINSALSNIKKML
ncbi:MarR family winged helix-turn-helix transcriptional regulator [Clostridium intestinale]|uniref:MarR family winged helix-turn-helix transcriptional regulator n=1 Tax=Clostridium intestinale TaxID=36845 RepID=UPI002DD62C1A|nr:MarR family transcriptional regulator [Clostridium intestinale]WRY52720.1 MarR family transcriptional regulator [Clostridium intestinale]